MTYVRANVRTGGKSKAQFKFLRISYTTLLEKIFKDDILTQAAALGFYSALALSPILVLLVTLLSSLNLKWHEQLIEQVQDLMGSEAAHAIDSVIRHSSSVYSMDKASFWSLIVLGISASAVFSQLQTSLNLIFTSKKVKKDATTFWVKFKFFIASRLVCIGMVLALVAITTASMVASGILHIMSSYGDLEGWMKAVHAAGDFLVFELLFTIIFRWIPQRHVQWPAAALGGFLTAVLFTVGKVLIGLYLTRAAIGSTYGVAGSLIVLLVWVYYSALIFLVGAEISSLLCQNLDASQRNQTLKAVL